MSNVATRRTLASLVLGVALAAAFIAHLPPALACDDEAGTVSSCAGPSGAADDALWMLRRVVAAMQADEPRALRMFSRGEGGFRTLDLYVFCIGAATGRVSAHPEPMLVGQDARQLRDPDGRAFTAEMLDIANEGSVSEVHYLYPRPGSPVPVPKTSFVTRIKDQVCGVGYYE
jgi:hypothetical protein